MYIIYVAISNDFIVIIFDNIALINMTIISVCGHLFEFVEVSNQIICTQ